MSHWRHMLVDGAEFWITSKRLKLLRKAGCLQLIQNLASSTILWRQCDIWIVVVVVIYDNGTIKRFSVGLDEPKEHPKSPPKSPSKSPPIPFYQSRCSTRLLTRRNAFYLLFHHVWRAERVVTQKHCTYGFFYYFTGWPRAVPFALHRFHSLCIRTVSS